MYAHVYIRSYVRLVHYVQIRIGTSSKQNKRIVEVKTDSLYSTQQKKS